MNPEVPSPMWPAGPWTSRVPSPGDYMTRHELPPATTLCGVAEVRVGRRRRGAGRRVSLPSTAR